MVKQIKINKKIISLDDWKLVNPNAENSNWARYSGKECVLLMVSWSGMRITENKFHWAPYFLGPDLFDLTDLYKRMYPNPPKFREYQFREAQNHIDKFIDRVNSLILFT